MEEIVTGNPLIDALPFKMSVERFFENLCHYPIYNQGDRKMNLDSKVLRIRQLHDYYQPFDIHLEIYNNVDFMLKDAYAMRNPFWNQKDFNKKTYENYTGIKNNQVGILQKGTMGIGKSLVGASGIGKTSAMNKIMSMFPTTITHSEHDFKCTQIPYLSVLAPFDGSLKTLLLNILLEVDSIVDTNFYDKAIRVQGTINMLISQVQQIITVYHVGLIIIDEFQFLNRKAEQVINFLTSVMNMWGVSLFLVGTPPVLSILQKDMRVARRFSLMPYKKMKKDEKEWGYLLNNLWQYQYTTQITKLTEEISNVFYHYSQGITDIFIKLFIEVQLEAVKKGRKITISLIREVAKEKMIMVAPMLEALQSKDNYQLLQYGDI